jgi:hypothetical protein
MRRYPMAGYQNDWKDYRRIRNQWFLVFLGYVPVVGLVALVSFKLFNSFVPAFVMAILWTALFLISGIRVNAWHCPRCGETFSGKWWYNKGLLAGRCVHCGLLKFQDQ